MDRVLERIKKEHLDERTTYEIEPKKKGFFSHVFKKFWWLILLALGLLIVSAGKNNFKRGETLIGETIDENSTNESEDSILERETAE